jgi:SAM-dependent methyltransferase
MDKRFLNFLQSINRLIRLLPGSMGDVYLECPSRHWLINPSELKNSHSVTDGFCQGQKALDWLSFHTNMSFNETILDAGCGDGRVASALARHGFTGRYFGFDIHASRIKALTTLFRSRPEFRFEHADIRHSYYNPAGRIGPDAFVYPYPAGGMDIVFYNSIFTHMKMSVIRHNLKEARRCLKKEGKIWATFFLLDDHLDPDHPGLKWRFVESYDEGMTAVPENPEKCVGYDAELVFGAVEEAGFRIERYIPGFWKARPQSMDQYIHDVIVAVAV